MSDGRPGMVFQQFPGASYKEEEILPQLFIYGQTPKYSSIGLRGRFKNIGVSFHSTALKSIFGIDAIELTAVNAEFTSILKDNLSERLCNTQVLDKQLEALESFFLTLLYNRSVQRQNNTATYATLMIRQGENLKDIRQLLNISERSLERLFNDYIGISPKLYTRICRFQASLEIIRNANFSSLTEIAYLNDYFDQSHFIRDFKIFAGTTPSQFIAQTKELIPNLADRK